VCLILKINYMKKTIITISLMFIFNITIADIKDSKIENIHFQKNEVKIKDIIPITPNEATFEDFYDTINIENLKPITPREADFNE